MVNSRVFAYALTLHQPYASLMYWMEKLIETRSWGTNYRGWVVIHAGLKRPPRNGYLSYLSRHSEIWANVLKKHGVRSWDDLPYGAGLCAARLIDCVPTEKLREEITQKEIAFGDYSNDRYGWVFTDFKPFNTPIAVLGHRRLWRWGELEFDPSTVAVGFDNPALLSTGD